jgi:hypothetical protein
VSETVSLQTIPAGLEISLEWPEAVPELITQAQTAMAAEHPVEMGAMLELKTLAMPLEEGRAQQAPGESNENQKGF